MKLFLVCFFSVSSLFTMIYSQSFKQKIDSVYSFKMADLSAVDLEKKYKQLDLFWQELNADSTMNLPLVRKELQQAGHSSYFYFDMASYLEMKSPFKKDRLVVEQALQKIVWSEINTWELVEKLREFSLDGIDITNLTMQLLKQEKVKLTDPETNEVFNQGKLLGYLLLPLKLEVYASKLNDAFDTSTPESQRSIVTIFWMTISKFGTEKLTEIASNKRANPVLIDVKSYADRLLRRFVPTEIERSAVASIDDKQRIATLNEQHQESILNWKSTSWDQLILSSKLLHYYLQSNEK